MKANELMIGDWVMMLPKWNRENKYETTIQDGKEIDEIIEGYHGIEPIPLTAEILKKNGFVKEDTFFNIEYYSNEDKTSRITLCKYNSNKKKSWCIYIDKNEIEDKKLSITGNIEFNYVHEMQHTLRLCNIDKEIIL